MWSSFKKQISSKLFSQVSLSVIVQLLEDYFGDKVYLENKTGSGSYITFWVADQKGEYIAVVKVAHQRRERKLKKKYEIVKKYNKVSAQDRLQREYGILEILSKKNVSPKPYQIGKDYLIQEFIHGEPLLTYFKHEKERMICEKIKLAINAIKKIHNLGVLHADLSLNNIFITKEGIKFIDFEHQLDPVRYSMLEAKAYDFYNFMNHLIHSKVVSNHKFIRLFEENLNSENNEIHQAFLKMINEDSYITV